MHRDLIDDRYLSGMERGLDCKQFVAELHDRGLSLDQAADTVCQLFAVHRGAARLYVRSHPTWASAAPGEGAEMSEASRSRRRMSHVGVGHHDG